MTDHENKPLHVLVLGGIESSEGLEGWINSHARVERVGSFDAAIAALKEQPYDVVISSAADFLPFKDFHVSQQAAAILDGVNQGVGIVGEDGEFVWANPKLLSFTDEVRQRVAYFCMETFAWAKAETGSGGGSIVRGRRFSLATTDCKHFEVTATPVIDLHHRVTQVAAVVWDATSSLRTQEKIDAIDMAGRELVRLDAEQFSRLDTQERLALLEQKILRCTKEVLHFDNFVVFVIDKRTNKLDVVLCSGMPSRIRDIELLVSPEGHGICGHVAARGRSYICPDVGRDPRYISGIEGAKSSLTVPLMLHDRIVGVANFESTRKGAFTEDDRQFAEIFGRYIAVSLNILELLVIERSTTTGRLGKDVMAEITGPVNDILTDVESLIEDYIGHDDLRHRLRSLSENAVKIRESIKELTSAKPGLIGARSRSTIHKDPLLAGKRVLIADDEDTIRETVRDVLTGYGCIVTAVADGGEAVAAVAADEPYDLVISDIKMPIKSGYELFAAAKEKCGTTPVILMTGFGYDPNHSIVRARREGLSAVLFKPFKVDQLLGEIRMALKAPTPAS